jgi:hypothetical protein
MCLCEPTQLTLCPRQVNALERADSEGVPRSSRSLDEGAAAAAAAAAHRQANGGSPRCEI